MRRPPAGAGGGPPAPVPPPPRGPCCPPGPAGSTIPQGAAGSSAGCGRKGLRWRSEDSSRAPPPRPCAPANGPAPSGGGGSRAAFPSSSASSFPSIRTSPGTRQGEGSSTEGRTGRGQSLSSGTLCRGQPPAPGQPGHTFPSALDHHQRPAGLGPPLKGES